MWKGTVDIVTGRQTSSSAYSRRLVGSDSLHPSPYNLSFSYPLYRHSSSCFVPVKYYAVDKIPKFTFVFPQSLGRNSSVGKATCYGLDGPGIESRWGEKTKFSAPVQTGPGALPAFYTIGTGTFPRVKRPGLVGDHPHPSSAEIKENIELYLSSPSGPSWPVPG
jgi:hypothetical protein